MNQKLHTAYHEAGHAVVAAHFEMIIDRVTIVPDEDYLGCVFRPGLFGYDFDGKNARKQFVRQSIIISYAGFAAEKLINPDADGDLSASDEEQAFDLLREFPPKNCSYVGDEIYFAYLERLRGEAKRLVKQLHPLISFIAQELLKREKLTGKELEELLTTYHRGGKS